LPGQRLSIAGQAGSAGTKKTSQTLEKTIEERLKPYTILWLLITDEIGYVPVDPHGAHLPFQLISHRYERGGIILTSNRSFGQWGDIFGDPVVATAIPSWTACSTTAPLSTLRENPIGLRRRGRLGFSRSPS
jgi:hypothetical protein